MPKKLREGGPLPLGYYMMRGESAASGAAPAFRAARSDVYRAVESHCMPFYKPISRTIKVETND